MPVAKLLTLLVLGAAALSPPRLSLARDEEAVSPHKPYAEAWWTGPLLAAGANALPRGHFLVEPYLYDIVPYGSYDKGGREHSVRHQGRFRSLTYLLYGLTDRLSVGVLPRFGFNAGDQGTRSSGPRVGDLGLHAHYQLLRFRERSWVPALSLVIEQTLPTGHYDQLGNHPGDGLGAGVYATTFAVYTQRYFWAPNGRIVRTRLNVSYVKAGDTSVRDVSVYGTQAGFRGTGMPGNSLIVDSAWEYSLTQHWVLALDISYEHDASTRVLGTYPTTNAGLVAVRDSSGASTAWSLAPAVEYNVSANLGVIVGANVVVAGRNASGVLVPAVAINWVR